MFSKLVFLHLLVLALLLTLKLGDLTPTRDFNFVKDDCFKPH